MVAFDDGGGLGVKRGTVVLRAHDPAWAKAATAQIEVIRHALDDSALDLQHVGSTAVPDLRSKPILDIAVALRPQGDPADAVRRLTDAGYVFRGNKGTEGGLLFVRTDEHDVRSVHVHVVDADSAEWRNYLAFRDVLRRDGATRTAYERLKEDAAARFHDDRASYTAAKRRFIEQTLSRGRRDD